MLTRLCVAVGGVSVASLSNHSVHTVHAASPAESAGVKGETKSETKGDIKSDTKRDTTSDTKSDVKTTKGTDTSSAGKKTKTTIKASELPIYGDPEPVTFELVEHKPSAYFTAVSDARKFVWTYRDSVKSATSKVCDAYEVTVKTTKDGLQYIQKDSGVVPRAAVISVAGLAGIIAGFRGGFFRKTFYASIAMAGAASVCYPDQAAAISKKGWRTVRDFTSQTYKDNVSQGSKPSTPANTQPAKPKSTQPTHEKKTDSNTMTETKPENTKPAAKPSSPSSSSSPSSPSSKSDDTVKKDFGMSNEEDKDMYSTRGAK